MKPTHTTTQIGRHATEARTSRFRRPSQTDCNFHPQSLSDFNSRCGRETRPSFLQISEGYFRREARTNFFAESTLFGVIVLISALPVIQATAGVVNFVRAIVAI